MIYTGSFLYAEDYWVQQPSPTSTNLSTVFFINKNTGWISGDSGIVLKTIDGGKNWDVNYTGSYLEIQTLFFINDREGWAVSWEIFPDSTTYYGTRLFRTFDGGINWVNYMYSDTSYFIKTIFFIDSLKGFMGGAPLTMVYTTDAGYTWNDCDTDSTTKFGLPVEQIKFINPLIGYACGGFRDIAGCMWRSTNGGLNWFATIVGPEPLNDFYMFDPINVIAAGGDFEYGSSTVTTSNQGLNWIYDTLGVFGVANSIDFRTSYEGWISLGYALKFAYSFDTGKTWTSMFTPDSIPIFGIKFTDSLNGWAVGNNGTILKYNSAQVGINSQFESSKNEPGNFILYQNFPNPFNPVTTISFFLEKSSKVSLIIYDALGKKIISLIDEKQNPGNHSVNFDASDLGSGIYFYKLTSGNYSETKRMLLLK